MKTLVVDYGLNNVNSIVAAIEVCGSESIVLDNPDSGVMKIVENVILPGVGTFSAGMKNLVDRQWDSALKHMILEKHIPILGICLGMQLLGKIGVEAGITNGLNFIDGTISLLEHRTVLPHVGWNNVMQKRESALWEGIPNETDFYFVHSYQFKPVMKNCIISTTDYDGEFISGVQYGNVFGVQFHPEKSGKYGMKLLKNFLKM